MIVFHHGPINHIPQSYHLSKHEVMVQAKFCIYFSKYSMHWPLYKIERDNVKYVNKQKSIQ